LPDKTEVFHVQIEAKQKELEPWTAKINKKQAEIDLAESERALLAEKAQSGKTAVDEATEALEKLREDKAAKAQELKDLKEQKKALDKEAETRGKKYKV
jgi:structural maintenance of chromosome 4